MKKLIAILFLATSVLAQEQPKRVIVRAGGDDREDVTRDWPKLQAPASQTDAARTTALGAYLDALVARDLFSGTVLVARDGKPLFFKSYGFANKEWSVPNTNDTKYDLGSINKFFTNLALKQLHDAGKLDYDKTLRAYVPDYPSPVADRITIKQLMEHRSGLGDFFGPEFAAAPKGRIRSLADYLPFFVNKPLLFEPGAEQRYSNAGYVVLGLVIEHVSGESYYDYVREHIFKPNGMTSTDSYTLDEVVPRRATGYSRGHANIYTLPARGSSAGGGYSTAEDLLRLVMSLPKQGGGLGIAGGSPGVNAAVETGGEWQIIVLANYDPPAAEEVAANVRKMLGLGGD
jgi:CubicO group peptidase (beta-lactamase class C family)